MKVLHLVVGLFVVVVFLLTGQYLEFHHPKMDELDNGTRMLLRSRHVYILLAGLLNLGIGAYFTYRNESWLRVLQITSSSLIAAAPFALIGAFFHEPNLTGLKGPLTLPGIIALFVGTLGHLLCCVWPKRASPPS